jgi:hypothetical protein
MSLRTPLERVPGFDPTELVVWYADLFFQIIDDNGSENHFIAFSPDRGNLVRLARKDAELRLEDGATRDKLSRFLGKLLGLASGSTAPEWRYNANSDGWWLTFDGVGHYFPRAYFPGLDPWDDTRLLDGSRQVDAQALALLCATKAQEAALTANPAVVSDRGEA